MGANKRTGAPVQFGTLLYNVGCRSFTHIGEFHESVQSARRALGRERTALAHRSHRGCESDAYVAPSRIPHDGCGGRSRSRGLVQGRVTTPDQLCRKGAPGAPFSMDTTLQ